MRNEELKIVNTELDSILDDNLSISNDFNYSINSEYADFANNTIASSNSELIESQLKSKKLK